jgi:hypothetical protein
MALGGLTYGATGSGIGADGTPLVGACGEHDRRRRAF